MYFLSLLMIQNSTTRIGAICLTSTFSGLAAFNSPAVAAARFLAAFRSSSPVSSVGLRAARRRIALASSVRLVELEKWRKGGREGGREGGERWGGERREGGERRGMRDTYMRMSVSICRILPPFSLPLPHPPSLHPLPPTLPPSLPPHMVVTAEPTAV